MTLNMTRTLSESQPKSKSNRWHDPPTYEQCLWLLYIPILFPLSWRAGAAAHTPACVAPDPLILLANASASVQSAATPQGDIGCEGHALINVSFRFTSLQHRRQRLTLVGGRNIQGGSWRKSEVANSHEYILPSTDDRVRALSPFNQRASFTFCSLVGRKKCVWKNKYFGWSNCSESLNKSILSFLCSAECSSELLQANLIIWVWCLRTSHSLKTKLLR